MHSSIQPVKFTYGPFSEWMTVGDSVIPSKYALRVIPFPHVLANAIVPTRLHHTSSHSSAYKQQDAISSKQLTYLLND